MFSLGSVSPNTTNTSPPLAPTLQARPNQIYTMKSPPPVTFRAVSVVATAHPTAHIATSAKIVSNCIYGHSSSGSASLNISSVGGSSKRWVFTVFGGGLSLGFLSNFSSSIILIQHQNQARTNRRDTREPRGNVYHSPGRLRRTRGVNRAKSMISRRRFSERVSSHNGLGNIPVYFG